MDTPRKTVATRAVPAPGAQPGAPAPDGRALLDALPEAIALVDEGGAIAWVNRAFERLLGRAAKGVEGESIALVAGPFAEQADGQRIVEAVAAGEGAFQVSAFSAEGRAVPAFVRVAPVDGVPGGRRLVTIADVTERQRLEAELVVKAEAARREKRLVRAIAESLPGPVVVLDDAERVALVNRAACRTFGLAADADHGRSLVDLALPTALRGAWLAFLASSEPERRLTVQADLDAGTASFPLRLARVRTVEGVPLGSVLLVEPPGEARAARADADFMAALTHELRTPLVSIQGFSQTLCEEPDLEPKLRAEFLAIVRREADRLGRLVEEMLQLVRLESDPDEAPPRPQDLASLVERCVERVVGEEGLDPRRIRVERSGIPAGVLVRDDSFAELMRELLRNAARHGVSGRGTLVSVAADARTGRVEIRDWGPGVPAAALRTIFDPFDRGPDDAPREGAGLGLHVCRRIVERIGGSVRAESPAGGGLRIVVELPVRA